jgi:hypothetical protein
MVSLSAQAQAALARLYTKAANTPDNFDLERIDRALDEILRLNSTDVPSRQVRSALANASKVILDRRKIVPLVSLDAVSVDVASPDGEEAVVDLRAWLHGTRRITEQQRRLLMRLADGDSTDVLAGAHRVPLLRMRERVSRARQAARAAYAQEVTAEGSRLDSRLRHHEAGHPTRDGDLPTPALRKDYT